VRPKLISFVILALSLPLAFNACTSSSGGGGNKSSLPVADFAKLKPSCFVPVQSNPIIALNGFFAGAEWNDPHVIKVGNQFVMYASADTNFVKNIKIYRLVSSDGQNWSLSPSTAVFEKSSDPAAWDRQSVETPAVVFFKGFYYLFYTGYSDQTDSSTYRVGYATSPDGINFTRQATSFAPTNPGGAPDLNFMQYVVGEPAPVVFNDKLYLYFSANGAHMSVMSTEFTIGLTTSSDGQTWSAPQMVLEPDQTLYPRSSWVGYSTPHAQVLNNQVHLFFDVAQDPFNQTKFHHAVSADGITNWNLDSTAIFDRSQFSWIDSQIDGPAVLLDGTNLYMWFGGQGNLANFPNINMGIGMAICPL
jgi:predicted GH43/DUF377 family glycosyl hydrolase